jgi:NTE family protein
LGDLSFRELPIPFAVTASDINSGRSLILNRGKVIDAVLATIAIPGIFPAREWGEYLLVDGGVTNPVPVNVVRKLAPNLPVIAVSLNQPSEAANAPVPTIPNIAAQPLYAMVTRLRITQSFQVFIRSMDISARLLAELRLEQDRPDVLIRPDIHDIGVLDQIDVKDVSSRGYNAALAKMDEIHKAARVDRKIMRMVSNYLKRNSA